MVELNTYVKLSNHSVKLHEVLFICFFKNFFFRFSAGRFLAETQRRTVFVITLQFKRKATQPVLEHVFSGENENTFLREKKMPWV